MKAGLQYRVRQNIFQGQTFAILKESYQNNKSDEDIVEVIRRRIFEYGGKVIGENDKANYVV